MGIKPKVLLEIETDTGSSVLYDYLPALSEFGYVDPGLDLPRERTAFNAPKKFYEKIYTYDAINPKNSKGFNPKLRRDDRRHDKRIGLDICKEEDAKPVPSRVSSDIGHYLPLQCDPHDRSHVRIQLVENQFYRRNGVDFKSLEADQDN